MKVVLLAGGFGTRLTEESHLKPKPMIEIGDHPILWHIMKLYSYYGFNDFIICAGYKQHVIKEYFADYYLHRCDVTFDFTQGNKMIVHDQHAEPWRVAGEAFAEDAPGVFSDCGFEHRCRVDRRRQGPQPARDAAGGP